MCNLKLKCLCEHFITINKVLSTIKKIQIINKIDFSIIALDANSICYVYNYLKIRKIAKNSIKKRQIKVSVKSQVGVLLFNKIFTIIVML